MSMSRRDMLRSMFAGTAAAVLVSNAAVATLLEQTSVAEPTLIDQIITGYEQLVKMAREYQALPVNDNWKYCRSGAEAEALEAQIQIASNDWLGLILQANADYVANDTDKALVKKVFNDNEFATKIIDEKIVDPMSVFSVALVRSVIGFERLPLSPKRVSNFRGFTDMFKPMIMA